MTDITIVQTRSGQAMPLTAHEVAILREIQQRIRRREVLERAVLAVVTDTPTTVKTITQLAGINDHTVRRALARLAQRGQVVEMVTRRGLRNQRRAVWRRVRSGRAT